MLTVDDALQMIVEHVRSAPPSLISLRSALGSTLAEAVVSPEDSPPFAKSMMDGFAVRAADVSTETVLDIIGEVTAGHVSSKSVTTGRAIRIMTGAPIPPGADCVVPIEWTIQPAPDKVAVRSPRDVSPGCNIIPQGESMRAGDRVLVAGRRIRAQELALLSELGHSVVSARKPPRVAVLATGDELVEPGRPLGAGQIRNSNGLMLAAQAMQWGSEVHTLGIARDERADLSEKIDAGLQFDFLILSGGVSAGKLDLVPSVLAAAGVRELFHKVAMKPGKPVWFGILDRDPSPCYVFGLPGNPVSSMVCFELFVGPAYRKFLGIEPAIPQKMFAVLENDLWYSSDRLVYRPGFLRERQGKLVIRPVEWKGSSDLRSTVDGNCSVVLPSGERTLSAGSLLEILPWGLTMGGLH